jgi:predicted nucleic acid-binding protein
LKKAGVTDVAFVLDPSAALAWCFRDEATERSEQLLSRADAGELLSVTAHWPLEILNALTRAARRGRAEEQDSTAFLASLLSYRIEVVTFTLEDQWAEALPLIMKHRLSAYDAAYLALARRLDVSLATFDAQLTLAARAEGVSLAV